GSTVAQVLFCDRLKVPPGFAFEDSSTISVRRPEGAIAVGPVALVAPVEPVVVERAGPVEPVVPLGEALLSPPQAARKATAAAIEPPARSRFLRLTRLLFCQ